MYATFTTQIVGKVHMDHALGQRIFTYCAHHAWVFEQKQITITDQPSYLPDSALCDYYLFPKKNMWNEHFVDMMIP